MSEHVEQMSDEELLGAIGALDRQGLPIDRRFEGDDDLIRDLCDVLGVANLVVNIQLVGALVLREAVARGLQLPRSN